MSNATLRKLTGAAGLGVVLLFVAGSIVLPLTDAPSTNDSPARLVAYMKDHHRELLVLLYLSAASMALFLCFLAGFRDHLRRAEGGNGTASALGFAGGIVLVGILLVAFACTMAVAYRSKLPADAAVVRAFYDLTWVAVAFSGFPTIVCLGAFSLVILRSGGLARWIGWLGVLAATAHVVSTIAFRGVGFLSIEGDAATIVPVFFYVWLAAASVAMLRVREPTTAP